MASSHVREMNINCPYCCKNQKCKGFQEIDNLIDTGWVIYRHTDRTEYESQGGEAGRSTNIPRNVFILYNRKKKKLAPANLLAQLDKGKIPCLRCRLKFEHAQKLINKRSLDDTIDIVGVCDHCFLKITSDEPCHICAHIVNKFLAARGEQEKYSNKYFKSWLIKMEHELSGMISEVKPQKKLQRSYSEINISLLSRDSSKTIIKCKITEMFHSEVNLKAINRKGEVSQQKNRVTGLETAVNFKDIIEIFHKANSDSDIKSIEAEPSFSREAKLIPSVIAKTLQDQNLRYKTENMTESAPETQRSFIFPQVPQKLDTTSKLYISSSELIKDTQEKLRLKAEEKKKMKEESERRALEVENMKTLTLEKKRKLLKQDGKLHNEVIIKAKPYDPTSKTDKPPSLEQDTQIVEKDYSRKYEKIIKEAHPISGKEIKDVEESSKPVEPMKRLEKVKTGEFDKLKNKKHENYKSVKSKKEEQQEKEQESEIKQLPQPREKNSLGKPLKPGDLKRNELPTSDIEQLSKMKKIESENEQGAFKAKKLQGKDMLSELTRKRQRPSRDIAGFENKRDEITSQEISKSPKAKSNRVEEVVTGIERKRDALLPTEKGKSEKASKLEDFKQNDMKLKRIKLPEANAGDLVSQMNKVNNRELAKDLIKSNVVDLDKKRDEVPPKVKHKSLTAKPDQLEELKETAKEQETKSLQKNALQTPDKSKSKKDHKLEDSKQYDMKLNQVELLKASPGDFITHLLKVSNKENAKDTVEHKQIELSKLLLTNTKAKEKFTEKITSIQEPKKKDVKLDLPTKETQEKELKMNQVKLVENSLDNLIFKLIQIKPSERTVSDKVHKTESFKRKKRYIGQTNTKSGSENASEESSEEFSIREYQIQKSKTYGGGEPALPQPPQREGQEIKPVYVHLKLSEISSSVSLKSVEEGQQAQLQMSKKKVVEPIDSEPSKGVIRYALSDRTFIEKGWTMLPVEKVVRKMNIYRMRPAKPEFDWFEHNKKKGLMLYDTGAKLAEFDNNGRGRWFYKNGRLALDYYEAEETNTQQRFVVYSNGELDERGRSHPITILATFDHLGNGVVFDHVGKIRLKYNQTEGVLLDRSVGPVTNWKWHSLNDPPILQQVMIDTQMPLKDPNILKMGGPADKRTRPDNEEMLAIEFDNFIKEKSKKLTQKFKPFQIKMKALKINDQFSLKVLDQATIYLIFRDGSANLKLNIGMVLDHKEIVDTDTAELGEVSNSMERFPARTDSLAALQQSVAYARRYERMRIERERQLRRPEPCISADNLGKAASRPLRPPLRILPTFPTGMASPSEVNTGYCKCKRKPSSSLYYSTQLL